MTKREKLLDALRDNTEKNGIHTLGIMWKEFFSFGIDDDGTMPRLGTSTTNNSMTVYCGFTYGNKPNTVFVYKKEINEALKNITYVEKKDIKKFTAQKYSFQ